MSFPCQRHGLKHTWPGMSSPPLSFPLKNGWTLSVPSDPTVSCIPGFSLTLLEGHFVLGHSHLIQVGALPLYRSGD